MNLENYFIARDHMLLEVENICKKEGIPVITRDYEQIMLRLRQGEYDPDKKTIFLDPMHADGGDSKCFIIAHELGHYFDCLVFPKKDNEGLSEIIDREIKANTYMVDIAKKHGLQEEAENEAKDRMRVFGSSYSIIDSTRSSKSSMA